jgi:alpha-beta hydrolase superfamily lysophospholipase
MTPAFRVTGALIVAACALVPPVVAAQFGFLRGSNRSGVTIRADDGRTVTAFIVEANQRPAAAVVLVPMLGRSKDDWQQTAEQFAEANITALAVDLPGHSAPADPKDLTAWHTVIGAAVGYLAARSDVRASAIGVAGASLGANLAVIAAASDGRIRSLALISPSLDYRGVRIETAVKQYGERPALLLASRKDPYAARSSRELSAAGGGLREMQWTETPAHGTVLLSREPDLIRSLVEWFRRTLAVN